MSSRWKSKSVWEADGKPDLDLLEPDIDQGLEQRAACARVHRVDQGLVAVAQVDTGPLGAAVERRFGQVRSVSTSGT